MASGSIGTSTPIRRRILTTASCEPSREASIRSDSGSQTIRMATAISETMPPKMNRPGQFHLGRIQVESGPAKAPPKP